MLHSPRNGPEIQTMDLHFLFNAQFLHLIDIYQYLCILAEKRETNNDIWLLGKRYPLSTFGKITFFNLSNSF